MNENLVIGPGITIGSGITITLSTYQPMEWDYSGDLDLLVGAVDLQTEVGSAVDLNN